MVNWQIVNLIAIRSVFYVIIQFFHYKIILSNTQHYILVTHFTL